MKIVAVIPEKYKPKSIGKCIYCGSVENLTDEHIVPYSLGGPWQLLNASCVNCARITTKLEREVSRNFFDLVRTKLGLPTYHPENRPNAFDFLVKIKDKEEIVNFPISDCPALFIMPILERPGYIADSPQRKGILIVGQSLHGYGLNEFIEVNKIKNITFSRNFGLSFARTLAKIAYGMVVHKYGLVSIKENYVIQCILGKKDDCGQWVGCENPDKSPKLLPKSEYLHTIEVIEENNIVGARIRLFANFRTPEYIVVVGHL